MSRMRRRVETFSIARGVRSFARRRFSMAGRDVGPGSVLDQDGANDDFKGSAARPPVLWAVSGEEGVVVGTQVRLPGREQGVCLGETFRLGSDMGFDL